MRIGIAVVVMGFLIGCHGEPATSTSNAGGAAIFSPLASLPMPHPGKAVHEGSWDRSGGNGDSRGVAPGQTLTLLDYNGAGIIHRFWITFAPRSDPHIHCQAILRMYWDNETEPSVECPIGAFFGVGFGEQKDYISLPLNECSGGYNCYWPMPFHKHARWTLENRSDRKIDNFYYNIDFTAYDAIPNDMKQFHASWRRENPTDPKHNYTILEAAGEGHFVGTALFMQAIKPRGIGFLEGDECIYIDQPQALLANQKAATTRPVTDAARQDPALGAVPQIIGTGTEDYFSGGWYFDHGLYSAPYHGVVIKDEITSRVSAYRWHIEDAIPFHKWIRVSIEHGNKNNFSADYSSVAYFYQSGPHLPYPPLPADAADLVPTVPVFKHFTGAIEAEELKERATPRGGVLWFQYTDDWPGNWSGGAQLYWLRTKPGDELTLELPAPGDGEYELQAYLTTAPDYATIQFLQDDTAIGSAIDLYSPVVQSHPVRTIGRVALRRGPNPITIRVIGKNEKSSGYRVGMDAFMLTRAK